MKRQFALESCTVFVVLLLSGCGSGGGGGTVAPLSSTMRPMTPGDSWSYSVNGTYTDNTGLHSVKNATVTSSLVSGTLDGQPVIENVITVTAPTSAGPVTTNKTSYYSLQTGALIADTDGPNSTLETVVGATGSGRPAVWQVGANGSASITYDNGQTTTENYVVLSNEQVSTPEGTFMAWKTNLTSTEGTSNTSETVWMVPQLGNFVKLSTVQTDTVAMTTASLTYVLTSTNVPINASNAMSQPYDKQLGAPRCSGQGDGISAECKSAVLRGIMLGIALS